MAAAMVMETATAMATGNNVRKGTSRDFQVLLRLEEISFGDDRFSEKQLHYLLTKAHADTYVIEERGQLQGAAIMLWKKGNRLGRLYSIVIDPAFRGRGLGEKLLLICENAALKKGRRKVSLEVRSDNKAAVGLYTKAGYQIVQELPGYYADGHNGVRMVKTLNCPV